MHTAACRPLSNDSVLTSKVHQVSGSHHKGHLCRNKVVRIDVIPSCTLSMRHACSNLGISENLLVTHHLSPPGLNLIYLVQNMVELML